MRLFVALHLDSRLFSQLEELQARFRSLDPRGQVRWVDPRGIHLTLKFLGETEESRLEGVRAAVGRAAAGKRAAVLGLGHVGAFPNLRRPRVVWVGLEERGVALVPLRLAVEKEFEPLGWERERRPFQPHLTLGRTREGRDREPERLEARLLADIERAVAPPTEPARLQRLALVLSHLGPGGARYEDLQVWELPAS